MLDALLTWHSGLVIASVYCSVTVVKTALGLYAPRFRHNPATKKLVLPLLATLLGLLLSQWVHPPVLTSDSEIILYGAVIGYCSAALWRNLVGLVPALKTVDSRLSGRPREPSSRPPSEPTIPAPADYPGDSLRAEERELP
jgi:hypothetical protein